jgi:methyltransferase family protein
LNRLASTLVPRGPEDVDLDSFDMSWYGHDGIDMREDRQLELLATWARLSDLFAELRADPDINIDALGTGRIQNSYFPTPDAEIYAAMLATIRPRLVLEVGGGFSTLVARRTINRLGLPTRLMVIDPQPRTDIAAAADDLMRAYVEDVDINALPLDSPLLLFIDSSHVTRAGGDVPYLYNRVVPRLPTGSVVHAHDVFIPYDYPPWYQARFYTEQYVLQALLQGNSRLEVLFAGKFLGERHPVELAAIFGDTVPASQQSASFWFRVAG